MGDTFVMSARQSAELDHAFERAGWTPADVKKLSSGEMASQVLPFVRGFAKIQIIRYIVDLDAIPSIPNGLTLKSHTKGGQFEWDPKNVRLHISPYQRRWPPMQGKSLQKELAKKKVFNANLLDFFLKNPHLIPEDYVRYNDEMFSHKIFFWGTVYRDQNDVSYVRGMLYDYDGSWCPTYRKTDHSLWLDTDSAATLV